MAGLASLFGQGSIGEQILVYNVAGQVIGAAIAPGIAVIQQDALGANPVVVLTPPDLADAVIRGFMPLGDAASEATQSGINGERFQLLVDLAGNSIGPQEAAAALLRGYIGEEGLGADSTSFQAAIAEGDLKDKWAPIIKQLAINIPSPNEVITAWVQAQISRGEAQTRYLAAGGDPTYFETAYGVEGGSPSPVQAGDMANRGFIPWDGYGPNVLSVQQAIAEGEWKNKWTDAWIAYAAYRPPVRTVTALLRAGSITAARALELYRANGLTAEDAAAEVRNAQPHTSSTVKALTEAQIVGLYESKLVTKTQAHDQLVALGYPASSADYLLELADLKAAAAATKSAVTRVQALFTGGKIDAAQATTSLSGLGLDQGQISELIAVWALETSTTVVLLTAAQWGQAFNYAIVDQPTAIAGIESLGYDAVDAWIILSIHAKGPLPDAPTGAPTPPAASA